MLDIASYSKQTKYLVALDSIIFGFDGNQLNILLVKRGPDSTIDTWSVSYTHLDVYKRQNQDNPVCRTRTVDSCRGIFQNGDTFDVVGVDTV